MSLQVRKIILHCSDTEDGPEVSRDAIRRYHMAVNGWSDIGYHFVIERVGEGIGLLPGRPSWREGAHCAAQGRNYDSLGVCVVGKFDEEEPPPELVRCVLDGLTLLAFAFSVPADQVFGHREFDPAKTCPGLKWDLDVVRLGVYGRLREGMVGGQMIRLDLSKLV